MKVLIALLSLVLLSFGQIPNQDWGYVTLNAEYQSNMFWWLYGATNDRSSAPLVIWLQGGPGGSSLFGDFLEIGPLDAFLKPRNTTWLNYANLLFIDNPIGTGFSYTNNINGFSTTDQEIATNLVAFLQAFFTKYPVFETTPLWIFSESYGGKMTANFGVSLDMAIQSGNIKANFQGVALGDSWISPLDCMFSYPPFMESVSLIDDTEAQNLTYYANLAQQAWNAGEGFNATNYWSIQQTYAEYFSGEVNFYNFLYYTDYLPEGQLNNLLNGQIKKQLGIPENVTWGGQSAQVFASMAGDFMRSGVPAVEYLLQHNYQVVVYSGQLDIIVDVICIEDWINKLKWQGLSGFQAAPRVTQYVSGIPNGFSKTFKNFQLWTILGAGHMVPADNAEMALAMFKSVIGQNA